MSNSLVIRKGTSLAKRRNALRAAQYIRMSTDYQRYSPQNQAAAIATYAQQQNLTIVRTYTDEGRSGLRIKNRAGLTELIDEVCSGHADFDHILVYDVSRWGRFQDIDESAHYEFLCKQNGIKVAYCAEQFDNDGSLLSSIVKNIKRVMAAEYSRELSVKVHAGQCRIANLGYRVGAPLTFGLRRELVDESRQSKGFLTKGQRKALQTDRVRLRLGSQQEAEIIRWIFDQFVIEQKSYSKIARELNQANVLHHSRAAWTDHIVRTILGNENYVGNIIHNRKSRRLGQKTINNPVSLWVRSNADIEPIVDQKLFIRAQKLMAERYIALPEDQMLLRLRVLLHRKGKLNSNIIEGASGIPSPHAYVRHFGSLRKAYALIGYSSERDCDWIDKREFWSEVMTTHATQVAAALNSSKGVQAHVDDIGSSVTVNRKTKIFFLTARQVRKKRPSQPNRWKLYRKQKLSGLLAVLRLGNGNREVADYLLLPASKLRGPYLWLSDTSLIEGATRAETLADLITGVKASV
jgi:DNA invertase Pin-like site-specific DNA recombinase